MSRRLLGLLLIIRGLSPFIVIWVILMAGTLLVDDVQAAMDAPLRNIQAEVANIQSAVKTVQANIDAVRQRVDVVVNQVQSFVKTAQNTFVTVRGKIASLVAPINEVINRTSDVIRVINAGVRPLVNVINSLSGAVISAINLICHNCLGGPYNLPDLSYVVSTLRNLLPNLGSINQLINNALSPLSSIFNEFGPAVQSIQALAAELQKLPPKFDALVGHAGDLVNGVRSVVVKWRDTLLLVGGVLFVLAVIYFAVPLIDNVTRGWRMLWGMPET